MGTRNLPAGILAQAFSQFKNTSPLLVRAT
jgi:hypothetical protein